MIALKILIILITLPFLLVGLVLGLVLGSINHGIRSGARIARNAYEINGGRAYAMKA